MTLCEGNLASSVTTIEPPVIWGSRARYEVTVMLISDKDRVPFTNMDWLESHKEYVIAYPVKCGMMLLNHSQTLTVQSLKFGNG